MARVLLAIGAGVLVAAAAVGCNAIVGIHEPMNGTTPAPAGEGGDLDGGADGGDETSTQETSTNPTDKFVGRWSTAMAMQTFKADCPSPSTTSTAVISQILTLGKDNTNIIVSPDLADHSCHISTTIQNDGITLVADPGATCTFTSGGTSETYLYLDPTTFKIKSPGVAFAHFQAHVTSPVAPGVICTFEEISTYTKDP